MANVAAVANGIFFYGSMIRVRDVTDGTSNTFLAGEKYVGPDWYTTGTDPGDNEDAMMGDNQDITHWTCAMYHPEAHRCRGMVHGACPARDVVVVAHHRVFVVARGIP